MHTTDKQSSPFLIRLEVLKMAEKLLCEEMYMKREYDHAIWERDNKVGDLPAPRFPTNEQLLEKAQALYSFITTKA